MVSKATMTEIETEYSATHKTSEQLYRRALEVMPSGVEADRLYRKPFPIYVARADGTRVWDVDGNELISLTGPATILGFNHPAVVNAITEQAKKGLIYSATHELAVELSEMVVRLIPCAEKVRWVTSGSEANALAIRVARAYTGRNKIIKFRNHFIGYWDESMLGVMAPFDVPMSAGVPKESLGNVLLADHNCSENVQRLIEESGDVAAVIMDPICRNFRKPNRSGFLEEVRQITQEKGVVLIFDEVMSGFRVAPGGAQEAMGVIPDLAAIAKPVGGGLPGGALVGKKDIIDVITITDDPKRNRYYRVTSQCTHAANPIVCAAALATLKILSTGEPQARMKKLGAALRKSMNEIIRKHDIPGCVYGNYGFGNVILGHECPYVNQCSPENCIFLLEDETNTLSTPKPLENQFYLAMLLNGVLYTGGAGGFIINAAVTEEDIEKVNKAFDRSMARLDKTNIKV